MSDDRVKVQFNCRIRPSEDEVVRAAMIRCGFKNPRDLVTTFAELAARGDLDGVLHALRVEKARPLPAWKRDLLAQR